MKERGRLVAWSLLILTIAAINYAGRFTSTGHASSSAGNNEVYSYSTFAGGLVIYAVWFVFVLAIAGGSRELLALRRPRSWKRGARLAVGAIVAIYLLEAAVSFIPLPQSPGKEQGLTPTHWEPAHAGAFAANVVLFTLVAPIVEELTFRGLGQSLLLALMGPWPSVLVVGIAFGLAHGLVEALLVLVPFGAALAWLRNRSDSVYPGMVVHGIFNGVALAAAVLN